MIDEDWNLLGASLGEELKDMNDGVTNSEIPGEGALDEMEGVLPADYENVLSQMSGEPSKENNDFDLMSDIEMLLQHVENQEGSDATEDVAPAETAAEEEDIEFPSFMDMVQEPQMAEANDDDFSFQDFEQFIEPMDAEKTPSVSDVFSESLGAVSSMEDALLEQEFNNLLPDQEKERAESREERKAKMFQKVFANVEDENETLENLQEEEKIKKQKEEEKKKQKEEKKKQKEEEKARKAELKEAKKQELAKKKEEKRKEKEALEATFVPEGKINKVGASIVVAACACLGGFILFNINGHAYNVSVDDAKTYVLTGHYTEAYQKLSGISLTGEDQEFFEQVQTVMLINKQINSYHNFKELGMEAEALDSLLKGLDRYDTHYTNAQKLGVAKEFDSFKEIILTELKNNYSLSEKAADAIRTIKDNTEYTRKLVSVIK